MDKKQLTYHEYDLDRSAVDEISTAVQEYLNTNETDGRSILKIRFTIEEILLRIMQESNAPVHVSIGMGKRFGRYLFIVRYSGPQLNPVESSGDEFSDTLLANMGVTPKWSYRKGTNTISLDLPYKAKRKAIVNVLIAAVLAVALGTLGRLLPAEARNQVDAALLTPMIGAFLGLLRIFGSLMIAFTVCSGVLGIGDMTTLGTMGRSVLLRFLGHTVLICALAMAASFPFLSGSFLGEAQNQAANWSEISKIVFDIFPSNVIDPFRDNNSMQIIVIALFIGIGLLVISEQGSHLRELVTEGTTLTQHIVSFICRYVPFLVFIMLLKQILTGDSKTILTLWKPFVLIVATNIILGIAGIVWTSVRLQYPVKRLVSKVTEPVMIAFSTASSMSALAFSMETCEKKLGVESGMLRFVYPFGTVVFKPGSIVFLAVSSCFYTSIYHVEVSVSWLIIALLTISILAVAMPPIPGAGTIIFTILFARLGIPAEALVLSTVLAMVTDYIDTGLSVLLLILEVARDALHLGRLEKDVLMADEKAA